MPRFLSPREGPTALFRNRSNWTRPVGPATVLSAVEFKASDSGALESLVDLDNNADIGLIGDRLKRRNTGHLHYAVLQKADWQSILIPRNEILIR